MIFYTHVEHSPTKTIYIKHYTKTKQKTHYKHTHTWQHIQKIQNNTAWLIFLKKKKEAWSCHTTFERTPLAPSKIPHSVQACNARFLSLWRHSSAMYLSSSICTYQPSSSLCSSTERLLKISKTNLKTFSEHSFGYVAPTVWHLLPADIRASPSLPAFKANLKTYLSRQAFWLICTC